jgi:hypothetical protein
VAELNVNLKHGNLHLNRGNMRSISIIGFLGILLAVVAGCSRQSDQEVVVYTSVDQVFSEPVFRAFEQLSGIRVRAVFDTEETKSTGILNRLIAERRLSGHRSFPTGSGAASATACLRGASPLPALS